MRPRNWMSRAELQEGNRILMQERQVLLNLIRQLAYELDQCRGAGQ